MDSRKKSNRKAKEMKSHDLYCLPNDPGWNKSRRGGMLGI